MATLIKVNGEQESVYQEQTEETNSIKEEFVPDGEEVYSEN